MGRTDENFTHLMNDCPSADDDKNHCKNVWLLEYALNDNQDDWSDLEKKTANLLGKTPQLSIVVFGREFDIEEKEPRWRIYDSKDETRPKPVSKIFLGKTLMNLVDFMEFYSKLIEINGHFGPGSYDFFNNNCVHFADALSVKLVENRLPVEYQLIAEHTAMRVGAIAAGACIAVGCLCAAAVASFKEHTHNMRL